MNDNERQSSLASSVIAGSGVGGIGCAIPVLVLVAIFAGRWLDARLGTEPYLLLVFILTSIIAGVTFMFTSAMSAARAAQRQLDRGSYPDLSDYPRDAYEEE